MLSFQEVTVVLDKIKYEVTSGSYKIPSHLLRLAKDDASVMPFIRGKGGFNYQFFALFTRHFQPKQILELGNLQGVSTVMMFSELPAGSRLTTVDIVKDQRYIPQEIYADKRVRFVYGDALDINIYGKDLPQGIDWLFTDTVHFYQQVKDEYDVYRPLLADGAFILIDDINLKDKRRLFDELPFEKWDLTEWCHHNGFGLFRFRKTEDFSDPVAAAALESARIGFRKFYSLKYELDNQTYRKFYSWLRGWAARHMKLATIIRTVLKPIKKLYTPNEKEY